MRKINIGSHLSNDSTFGRIFGKAGDVIITNLLFVLCSIPIFTIGASISAMMYTFFEIHIDGEGSCHQLFFKGFKKNFKQATGAWLLTILLFFFLVTDIHSFGPDGPLTMPAFRILCSIILAVVIFVAIWLFAVIPSFDNKLKELVKQSFYFAARHLPITILMAALLIFPIWLTFQNFYTLAVGVSLWIFFGFGLIGEIDCQLMFRVFRPYQHLPEDQE